jgi:hemin uptake protein HemP
MTGYERSGPYGIARTQSPLEPESTAEMAPAASVDSATLLKGRRELAIRHGADVYRLRLTSSNKLILTK